MADGVGDVVAGHLAVVVGFHREGGVDAAQLLDGEDARYQKRLGPRVKAAQLREFLAQPLHGRPRLRAVAV